MFEYIGDKIQLIARIAFVLGVIGSVIYFVGLLLGEMPVIVCLLIAVACIVGSWVSACLIYGFGEMINRLNDLVALAHRNKNDNQ